MSQLILPKNVFSKPVIEYRSMPTLVEQRNTLVLEMEDIIKKAKEETRSMNEDEQSAFAKAKADIENIDKTLAAEEEAQKFSAKVETKAPQAQEEEKRAWAEAEDALKRFIRGEERALDVAGNGGVIPTLIADRIIQRVKELSPIYARATVYNVGGDLVFPSFDYTSITTAYVADMTALTPQNGNFTTIKLQNFIAGSLVQISRSLMNRTDFDLVTFIVNNMAMSIANFLENNLLNGTGTTQATGIFKDTNAISVTAAGTTAIAMDDLVSTQLAIPEVFQPNACWIMNKTVFSSIRKLKDTTGQYLMSQEANPSVVGGFGWTLLGKPVFVSENAPNTMTTGLKVLAYGDMSGLYVKLAQNVEIQVLNELYATSHAVGVVGYIEFDSKIVESQKIAVLKLA